MILFESSSDSGLTVVLASYYIWLGLFESFFQYCWVVKTCFSVPNTCWRMPTTNLSFLKGDTNFDLHGACESSENMCNKTFWSMWPLGIHCEATNLLAKTNLGTVRRTEIYMTNLAMFPKPLTIAHRAPRGLSNVCFSYILCPISQ